MLSEKWQALECPEDVGINRGLSLVQISGCPNLSESQQRDAKLQP